MAFNAEEIVKKLIAGDATVLDNISDEENDQLLQHPYFSDPDWEPEPPTKEELAAIAEDAKRPEATDDEVDKFGSDIGPMCSFCKHEKESNRDKILCDAFPEKGVPVDILRGFDHRDEHEGDNGVRFEPKPGMEKAFLEWFDFFYGKSSAEGEEKPAEEAPKEEKPVEEAPKKEDEAKAAIIEKVRAKAKQAKVAEEAPVKVVAKAKSPKPTQ
jgi:hypothetical protein